MHAENFLVDEGGDRQAIEDVAKDAPESNGISTLAFIVETIDAVDLGALVIAPEKEEVLRVLNLVAEKKADGFNRLLSAVDVVTQEEVVCFRWEPSVFEDPQ